MQMMSFRGPTFLLEVPTTWVVSSTPQFQALFLGPIDYIVRPSIAVSMRPVKADVTVTAVAEQAKVSQGKSYPQYQVLNEADYSQQGSAFIRQYSWHNESKQVDIVQIQAYILHSQVLYTLTATRPASIADEEAAALDGLYDHAIQSFRVVVPASMAVPSEDEG